MHSHSFADYVECLDRGNLQGVGALMLSSASKLAAAGADFLICPDNTIHKSMPYVEGRSPLPWLHIAAVVASEAAGRGYKCVGLTGTRWLVESDVYPTKLAAAGLKCVRPSSTERAEIHQIIMEELVRGIFSSDGVACFQRVFARMREHGCDAVILGCTEIPLLMNDSNSPLPTLDSTRLLARAALRRSVKEPDTGS